MYYSHVWGFVPALACTKESGQSWREAFSYPAFPSPLIGSPLPPTGGVQWVWSRWTGRPLIGQPRLRLASASVSKVKDGGALPRAKMTVLPCIAYHGSLTLTYHVGATLEYRPCIWAVGVGLCLPLWWLLTFRQAEREQGRTKIERAFSVWAPCGTL